MTLPASVTPDDIEHLVYEALSQIGWKADARRLASRLVRLHVGLPREDEFSVVCTWLGRCTLIHKLDQRQTPSGSNDLYQVPDLLAVFNVGGQKVPLLIEVKSNSSGTLSFRPDYYARLKKYAALLHLPLLVAWKYHGIWSLFDIDHMHLAKTNFNISFGKAMTEGLLGMLAGDFSYSMAPGAGVHLSLHKKKLLSETGTETTLQQEWMMVIDDVYFTTDGGIERRDITDAVKSLFFAHSLEETEEHTPTHVRMHFTVGEDRNKFAHMALVSLLNWQAPTGTSSIDWRSVAAKPAPLPGIDDYAKVVHEAMHQGIVTHIFNIEPRTKPGFIIGT